MVALNKQELENLLNDNKPAEVLENLLSYKGRESYCYFLRSEAYRLLGKFEEAINEAKKAQKFAKTGVDKIDILLALSKCCRTLGDAKEAQKYAARAGEIARKEQLLDQAVLALQEVALALRAEGKLKESKTLLKEVQEYYESEKDYEGLSFIAWALGGICRLEGEFKEGINLFKQSYKYAAKINDKISMAYALCGLAGIMRVSGDAKNCVLNYEKAEKLFSKTQDIFGKAYTNCGMANGLRQLEFLDKAAKHYKRAALLYTAINDTVDLGFVKWGQADIFKRQNKLTQAKAVLEEAKKLFAKSDEIRGQLLTEISLAQVIYALGDKVKADKIYFAAVERAKKEGLHTYLEIYT